ncbi:Lrp/AsnC family transcriptional regulator [Siminovitchia acidinfaciens]|uniref:Lrp/AsnC family transcriptional regulator n=1 Tax=Siminovitchia acidinfaciens TaxID=2321395 RepID=A0A429XT88_9BACI|nr:Lrp/AsnC family transcriptional regulator [Siminovitchia acidinfaciens]RST70819.1 Lrp/AsnC family transcriptional regulator [Siminovitchia acidinfaciens]
MLESLTRIEFDEIDRKLLNTLQKDATISNVELARRVNLSPPATHTRIKRLEREGVIEQYVTLLNKEKLGFDLICFIFLKATSHQKRENEQIQKAILEMPEILECHSITGEYDYFIKAVIKNSKDLKNFVAIKLSSLPGISGIYTSISYEELKSTTNLPITV